MTSLLAIDVGFDPRVHDMLVNMTYWRTGVQYHPGPGCVGKAELRSPCLETMAETLAKAGYSVVVAHTANGRDVRCYPAGKAPNGDRPNYEWSGPVWAVQAKNDNYWCLGPSLTVALTRAGWRDSEVTPLDKGGA